MGDLRHVLLVLFAVASQLLPLLSSEGFAEEKPARSRALLIGCTTYDHLEPSRHLQGPANDVALMRDLLCQRFGFPAERVVILAESSGRPDLRPTRANIEREFQRLGREAMAGEQIVVFLAGHGSQQPDVNPSPDDPEPDGLDELFLPADVKAWNGRAGRVANAIVDDELRVWLSAIEQRRAAVTVIVDSCCSGTMTRGINERVRHLPPGVLVPIDVIEKARPQAARVSVQGGDERTRGSRQAEVVLDTPSVVAIYAAQSTEATVEQLLPSDGQDRKPYGLLTYTMSQILSRSTHSMTYRELVRQIQAQYVGWGRSTPTPMIEGRDRDRELFGMSVWPDRSRITLTKTARGWSINAGILHEVTQNSILAVFPLSDREGRQPTGHVRAQIARTVDADVVPCDVDGRPATAELPENGRCELVFVDAGDLRLRVAMTHEATADPTWINRLKTAMQPTSPANQRLRLVQWVESAAEADWLVRVRERDIILLPAESGLSGDTDSSDRPRIALGPSPLDHSTVEWLGSALERIARTANLKKLAAGESTQSQFGDSVRVELNIDRGSAADRPESSERPTLHAGEKITIRVKNPCRFPVDVTLLYLDSQCGINALFPQRGENNRLGPDDSFPISTLVVAETWGLEHLVVIAVKADREVVDFTVLAQPSLEVVRTRNGIDDRSLTSPLGELLKQAVFAKGQTRGMKRTAVKAHSLQLRTWEVQPKEYPGALP